MGYWDRQRRTTTIKRPARLLQLDREIMTERSKDFDYVYAVKGGMRIKVCVMRDEDYKYYATAQIGKKAFRNLGGCPSAAFLMLSVAMNVYLAQLPAAERQRLANAQTALAA